MQTSEKNTICIFSALYLPNVGGVENYTYNLSKALIKLGHKVIVITNNTHGNDSFEITPEGIKIYRLPCIDLINARFPIPRIGKKYRKIKSIINKLNPDFVVINTRFYPLCITAVRFAKKKQVTPIVIEHGSAYLTLGNSVVDFLIKIYEHLITLILKTYHPFFYGVSTSACEWLKNYSIQAHGVLHNSIDADNYYESASERNFRQELHISNKDFVVSFVGRLVPEKGVVNLVEAATMLNRSNKDIFFLFAGDGPLLELIQDRNCENIISLGRLTSPDIASLLKTSDAFCLPTRSEGFSTSLLEAAACYTTPIITKVGGVTEMIPDNHHGIILQNQTAEEIVRSILYINNNKTLNLSISKNIGGRVRRHFSWKDTATKTINACRDANSSK